MITVKLDTPVTRVIFSVSSIVADASALELHVINTFNNKKVVIQLGSDTAESFPNYNIYTVDTALFAELQSGFSDYKLFSSAEREGEILDSGKIYIDNPPTPNVSLDTDHAETIVLDI